MRFIIAEALEAEKIWRMTLKGRFIYVKTAISDSEIFRQISGGLTLVGETLDKSRPPEYQCCQFNA